MAVLANSKHYAKERSKKINNINNDNDKSDHTQFQEIFGNATDDLVEEHEYN